MQNVDMIIKCKHMFTMEGEGVGYIGGQGVAVDKGKIVAILPLAELEKAYAAAKVVDATDKVLLPGFIDGHMHTGHGVIRGVAQDIGNWMMDGIAPFDKARTLEDKAFGNRLTAAEAVMNGTTTLGEDGGEPTIIEFIDEIGARGNVSIRVRDTAIRAYKPGELYEYDDELGKKTLNDFITMYDKWNGRDNGRILIRVGPQGADFVSLALLQKVRDLALERKTKIIMHLEQGDRESKQMMMRHGKRSIPYLSELGYLDENVIGIHLTSATDEEVEIVVRDGASMVVCSNSIGVIDGIVPPAKHFQEVGGMVALGSDQAAGNNAHNIIKEMNATATFNKIKFADPEVMPAWKVLRMATIEGAKALGLDGHIGSIKVGKDADLILIDLKHPGLVPFIEEPMRTFVPNLVYAGQGNEVDTVIVRGKILVENRKPLTFDLDKIMREAQECAEKVGKKAVAQFNEINGKNAQYMREGKL